MWIGGVKAVYDWPEEVWSRIQKTQRGSGQKWLRNTMSRGALPTEMETLWDFLFLLFLNIMYVLLVGGTSLMGVYPLHYNRENIQVK